MVRKLQRYVFEAEVLDGLQCACRKSVGDLLADQQHELKITLSAACQTALSQQHKDTLSDILTVYSNDMAIGEFVNGVFRFQSLNDQISYDLTDSDQIINLAEILPLAIVFVSTTPNPHIDPLVCDLSQTPYFEGFYVTGWCSIKTFLWKINRYIGCGNRICTCSRSRCSPFIAMIDPIVSPNSNRITAFVSARAGTAHNLGLIHNMFKSIPY